MNGTHGTVDVGRMGTCLPTTLTLSLRHIVLRRITGAMIATIAVCMLAIAPAAHADRLAARQAQASRIQAQVDALTHQLDGLNERYMYDMDRLAASSRALATAGHELQVSQRSYRHAYRLLVRRAIQVYENGGTTSVFGEAVRSGSVGNLFDRLDVIARVTRQDTSIVAGLTHVRRDVTRRKVRFARIHRERRTIAAEARATRDAMARQTQARRQVLESVQADVRQIIAERERAAREAAEARARAQALQVATTAPAPAADPASGIAAPSVFTPPALEPSSGSGSASEAASVATRYLGVPYVWGGSSPSGFDCSGLVMYAYAQVGISLPHSSYAQWNVGRRVDRSQLERGDIVFFSGLGHVGMYLGGGQMIHAPHSGTVVQIESMTGWYASSYVGAVRVT